MKPAVSIIIPCHNSQSTLQKCLESVFALAKEIDYEVIIVDDGSEDQTILIAQRYPVKIYKTDSNKGAAYARNLGVKQAQGDLILFIDSDVILPAHPLDLILESFQKSGADCVVGVFSAENPFSDFFSQYKSLYCHFKYQDLKGAPAVNTAIAAIKKKVFAELNGFDERMLGSEDNELADRLHKKGFKITIDTKLEVVHLKEFNCLSLLKNDFQKSRTLSKIFFRNLNSKTLFVNKKFTDISLDMIWNVPLVYLTLSLSFFWVIFQRQELLMGWIFFGLLFLLNNQRFWIYIFKKKGLFFTLEAVLFTFLDYLVVGLGVLNELRNFLSHRLIPSFPRG